MKARKLTIQVIPVCYLVKVGSFEVIDIFGNTGQEDRFLGDAHLFEVVTEELEGSKPVKSRVATSFCGKDSWTIGAELSKEYQFLPSGVAVCEECEAAWKADPRSPWRSWQKAIQGEGQK